MIERRMIGTLMHVAQEGDTSSARFVVDAADIDEIHVPVTHDQARALHQHLLERFALLIVLAPIPTAPAH